MKRAQVFFMRLGLIVTAVGLLLALLGKAIHESRSYTVGALLVLLGVVLIIFMGVALDNREFGSG